MYHCGRCGAEVVIMLDRRRVRTCSCEGAPIIAEMEAHAHGVGGTSA